MLVAFDVIHEKQKDLRRKGVLRNSENDDITFFFFQFSRVCPESALISQNPSVFFGLWSKPRCEVAKAA